MRCVFCKSKEKNYESGRSKIKILKGGVVGKSYVCDECAVELLDTLMHQINSKSKVVKELKKTVCATLDRLIKNKLKSC